MVVLKQFFCYWRSRRVKVLVCTAVALVIKYPFPRWHSQAKHAGIATRPRRVCGCSESIPTIAASTRSQWRRNSPQPTTLVAIEKWKCFEASLLLASCAHPLEHCIKPVINDKCWGRCWANKPHLPELVWPSSRRYVHLSDV